MGFEVVILKAIYSLVGASGFLDGFFVFCARFLVYITTVVFLSKLLVHREPYERLLKIFYTILSLVFSTGIFQGIWGYLVSREAPAVTLSFRSLLEYGATFPAFMTTWAVAIAMIASIVISKRLGFWLMIGAVIIGFSQLYTGVHWPLDIIGSFIIGIAGPLAAKQIITPTKI
ncbi:MAG: phosphatase PAP2 family protein [bacterium]|nr:phosphatase PAP2 family protein [bacterium]